jgi:hypothetical protein
MNRWAAGVAILVGVHALPSSDVPRLPEDLAATGLYDGTGAVDARNRAFAPQYPLWSDGLAKKRWVFLPAATTIDSSGSEWTFATGTKFWKEFSRDGRRVETRLLWKASDNGWLFGSYVWNAEGSKATLAPEQGAVTDVDVTPGRPHIIPSRTDCLACHGTERTGPLGFNALQLSTDRDPNAIHGEALSAAMLTLRDLVGERRLHPARAEWLSDPPRIRSTNPVTRSALGYLVGNCAHCHNGRGEIAALGPTLRVAELLQDGDAVARALIGQATRWQMPRAADGTTVLVHPGSPDASALLVRMRSRSPSSQMPPLGTVVRDQAAVDALTRWIAAELATSR